MNHNHCCKHLNLRYCPVCKVIYCVNCKKEWVEKTIYTFTYPCTYYIYPSYYTHPYDPQIETGTAGGNYEISTSASCDHS